MKIWKVIFLINLIFADREAIFFQEFGGKGSNLGKISSEVYIAFDSYNNIYFADTKNKKISVFSPIGEFIYEIKPTEKDKYQFNALKDITIDDVGNIYVVDWQKVKIPKETIKIYCYRRCIHKFDSLGNYLSTFFLEDLDKIPQALNKASLIIDEEGQLSYALKDTDYQRKVLIEAYGDSNLYVLDHCMIYKFHFEELKDIFDIAFLANLQETSSMSADSLGNLYIADRKNNCILKFSPFGKLLLSIGEKGYQNNKLKEPLLVKIINDNKLIVVDSTEFISKYKSYLLRKENDPIFKKNKYKKYQKILLKLPIFNLEGDYEEKLFCKIPQYEAKFSNIELLGIDALGNLYFIDPEKNTIQKYKTYQKKLNWKNLDKTLILRTRKGNFINKIDNYFNLDPNFDYLSKGELEEIKLSFKLSYDVSEVLFLWLINSLSWSEMNWIDLYPGDYNNLQLNWIQDEKIKEDYINIGTIFGIGTVLDYNPYNYREAGILSFVNFVKNNYLVSAIHSGNENYLPNQRYYKWLGYCYNFGLGFFYDIKRDITLITFLTYYSPQVNDRYVNEKGILKAKRNYLQSITELFIGIDTLF